MDDENSTSAGVLRSQVDEDAAAATGSSCAVSTEEPEGCRPAMCSDTRELTQVHPARARRVGVRLHRGKLPPFDPMERLLQTTRRENLRGMTLGLLGALLLHSTAAAHGLSSLLELGAFAKTISNSVQEDVRATVAVEVNKPPPPPEPVKPDPDPEPVKPQIAVPKPANGAPAEPPPAPAEAGKVLTAEADPNEPLDLTDQGFVTGEGESFRGGVTAANGTSKVAVRDLNAKVGGVPGGKGTGEPVPPPPPPKADLSRPAMPASLGWECGWPPEADVEDINFTRVSVVITVGTDGRATNVTVLKDPGYGFGRVAKQCAMRKTYNVGLDSNGRPTVTTTPPITIKFTR